MRVRVANAERSEDDGQGAENDADVIDEGDPESTTATIPQTPPAIPIPLPGGATAYTGCCW
jgi:hypothetical protein